MLSTRINILSLLGAAMGLSAPGFVNAADYRTQQFVPGKASRSRYPHSNAADRRRDGIQHGTPGAKLARRAAAGTLTKVHGGLCPKLAFRRPFSEKRSA